MLNVYQANTYYSRHFYNCEVTPKRIVGFYELEYYRCGNGFSCIDGARYPHTPGMVIFAKPGQTRFSLGSFECECIHFDCNEPMFLQYARAIPDVVLFPAQEVQACMIQASQHFQIGSSYAPLILYSLILRILAIISEHLEESCPVTSHDDRYFTNITAVKEYLDNHFQEKITLKSLAQLSYMSPNFMRIKFQELMGISPHAYLEEIRMNHVCRLLTESALPIGDIAIACGFDSAAYLDSVFRRKKGIPPSQYRMEHRKKTSVSAESSDGFT